MSRRVGAVERLAKKSGPTPEATLEGSNLNRAGAPGRRGQFYECASSRRSREKVALEINGEVSRDEAVPLGDRKRRYSGKSTTTSKVFQDGNWDESWQQRGKERAIKITSAIMQQQQQQQQRHQRPQESRPNPSKLHSDTSGSKLPRAQKASVTAVKEKPFVERRASLSNRNGSARTAISSSSKRSQSSTAAASTAKKTSQNATSSVTANNVKKRAAPPPPSPSLLGRNGSHEVPAKSHKVARPNRQPQLQDSTKQKKEQCHKQQQGRNLEDAIDLCD